MKFYQFIVVALASVCCYNCSEEDSFTVEEIPYKRVQLYDTNSSDKVLQFESRYYYNYGRFFITNPDSSDYLYNFSSKNEELQFTHPDQDREHLWKGIEMVKKLLLDAYPEEFIRKHFPYSIILADGMLPDPYGMVSADYKEDWSDLYYVGRYFLIFSIQDIEAMSAEERSAVSAKLHETLWRYIGLYNGNKNLPEEFYDGGESYGQPIRDDALAEQEGRYTIGFPYVYMWFDMIPIMPARGEEIGYWMRFLIDTPDDELQQILAEHEKMQTKYTQLVRFFESVGIDYKKLRYKEE